MESGHKERGRDTEEKVPYIMLLEAAILGSPPEMEELRRLLQDDPAILDRLMLECRGKDNPLHVGALYGHVEFVREILNRKPELILELNSEGQSPLHVASASGHVEVVKEILERAKAACFIRDRDGMSHLHLIRDKDGMIPLHLAAIQGRVEVLEALVEAEKITAFVLTKSGEPVPHLCAKNNKFEALKKLIELVKDVPDFVNLRDRDDNTILHLLSAKANFEVIKILVEEDDKDEKNTAADGKAKKNTAADGKAEKNTAVGVNAKNKDGFTPLDVSLGNENLLRGFKIQMLLIGKGAKRGGKNSLFLGLLLGLDIKGDIHGSWFAEALLVVAILMATVAFQARLNPPGGVWQDTGYHNATLLSPNALQSSPPKLVLHYAGESIMSYVDSRRYRFFSIFNDLMLSSSLLVIQLLFLSSIFKNRRLRILAIQVTDFALMVMSATYFASATFFSSDKLHLITCSVVLVSSMMLDISFNVRSFLLTGSQLFLLCGKKIGEFCKTA